MDVHPLDQKVYQHERVCEAAAEIVTLRDVERPSNLTTQGADLFNDVFFQDEIEPIVRLGGAVFEIHTIFRQRSQKSHALRMIRRNQLHNFRLDYWPSQEQIVIAWDKFHVIARLLAKKSQGHNELRMSGGNFLKSENIISLVLREVRAAVKFHGKRVESVAEKSQADIFVLVVAHDPVDEIVKNWIQNFIFAGIPEVEAGRMRLEHLVHAFLPRAVNAGPQMQVGNNVNLSGSRRHFDLGVIA